MMDFTGVAVTIIGLLNCECINIPTFNIQETIDGM